MALGCVKRKKIFFMVGFGLGKHFQNFSTGSSCQSAYLGKLCGLILIKISMNVCQGSGMYQSKETFFIVAFGLGRHFQNLWYRVITPKR